MVLKMGSGTWAPRATSDWRVIAPRWQKTHAYSQRKRVQIFQSVQMTHTCQKSTIAKTILRRLGEPARAIEAATPCN